MSYKEKKFTELDTLCQEIKLEHSQFLAIENFLSSTIEEVFGCLPKTMEYSFNYSDTRSSKEDRDIVDGYNMCRRDFIQNYNEKGKKP